MNSVTTGFCADINDGITDTFSLGEKNFFLASNAESQRVDERILRVTRFEADFASHCGNTEAVAVVGDAADYAIEDAAVGSQASRVA